VNFDETGTRVKCIRKESMIIPIEVMEIYKASPENRKLITIYEVICANGSEPPPPFIIIPSIKVIKAWII
jgi:hypothetical protein